MQGPSRDALRIAHIAFALGVLYAAVSVYWGLGGTWLLDTVGGSLARRGHAGDATVLTAVWGAAVVKVIVAVLPLLAVRRRADPAWTRRVRILAWAAAVILIAYGAVETVVGLLVQSDLIHVSPTADHRALAWHAYLWDPWFLIWGLLIAVALRLTRDGGTKESAPLDAR
ncbi:MAG: DUF3995 domain-containing protein [Solirubrobacteraceae bacterium]